MLRNGKTQTTGCLPHNVTTRDRNEWRNRVSQRKLKALARDRAAESAEGVSERPNEETAVMVSDLKESVQLGLKACHLYLMTAIRPVMIWQR